MLYVAFDQRDEAWTTAEMIIKGIQTGKINSKNLTNYVANEVKTKFSSPSAVSLVINKIKSFGNKAILSTNYTKGTLPDYMIIKKEKGQTKVNIAVIKRINSKKQIITIALSADYPYKKWLLEGIYFTTLFKFPNFLPLPNSSEKPLAT